MSDTTETGRPLDGQVIIDEDRHTELETKAALADEIETELEEATQTLERYEEHLEIANGAYAAALAAEGPHSEELYQDASLQAKRRELARLRGNDVAALAQYGSGDTVSYGQGEKKTGVVLEVLTSNTEVPVSDETDEEVEASQDSPMYVVAAGHSDSVEVFSGSDLSSGEFNVDLENPAADLKDGDDSDDEEAANAASGSAEQAALDWSYPRSWRKSKKPNRIILLDAWSSMGGTWRSCYPKYGGKRFCSAMKDKVWGTTAWRRFND